MLGNTLRIIRWMGIAVPLLSSAFAYGEDAPGPESAPEIMVSVAEQRLVVLLDGKWLGKYKVSTSKFGLGDRHGSYKTPVGKLRVSEKIGGSLKSGAVIKHRNATGEILPINSPGRDPIVTRIIWLEGLEEQNKNAKGRGIYIHGTVEEARIGQPVSYGCIRMRSREVMDLFEQVPVGTLVTIQQGKLPRYRRWTEPPPPAPIMVVAAAKQKTPPESAVVEELQPTAPAPRLDPVAELTKTKAVGSPVPSVVLAEKRKSAQAGASPTPSAVVAVKRKSAPPANVSADAPLYSGDAGAAEALKGSILFSGIPGLGAADRRDKSESIPEAVVEETAQPPAISFRKGPTLRKTEGLRP